MTVSGAKHVVVGLQHTAKGASKTTKQKTIKKMHARFLAHDAARLITGETLYIDGGYHIMD